MFQTEKRIVIWLFGMYNALKRRVNENVNFDFAA